LIEREKKFELEFNSLYTPIPGNISLNTNLNFFLNELNTGAGI
jgi:hypothetical protein